MSTLPNRLRSHVVSRGGMAKDADGNPVVPNGAWAMMLEAADEIDRLRAALLKAREQIVDQQSMPDPPTYIDDALMTAFQ